MKPVMVEDMWEPTGDAEHTGFTSSTRKESSCFPDVSYFKLCFLQTLASKKFYSVYDNYKL